MRIVAEEENYASGSKGRKSYSESEPETLKNYLDIWKSNPSYEDEKKSISIAKGISLLLLFFFIFLIPTFMVSLNIIIAVSVSVLFLVAFIYVFQDNFFGFKNFISYRFRNLVQFNPFDDYLFFTLESDDHTVYLSNKKDLTTVAIRMFEIKKMAEGITPSLNGFFKSLNEHNIPYTYQVVHKPILSKKSKGDGINRPYKMSIIFSIYHSTKGILNNRKLEGLREKIEANTITIDSNLKAIFHHFKVHEPLEKEEVIEAIKTFSLQGSKSHISQEKTFEDIKYKEINPFLFLKVFLIGFIVIYTIILLVLLGWPLTIIGIFVIAEIIALIYIWYREILYQFTLKNLQHNNQCKLTVPFKNVDFYLYREFPGCLFTYIDNRLLTATKIYNLSYAAPKLIPSDKGYLIPFCHPDRFYSSIIGKDIPFRYTVMMEPLLYYYFDKEGNKEKFIKNRTRNQLKGKIQSEQDGKEWLDQRSGVWRTTLTLSTLTYKKTSHFKVRYLQELGNKLYRQALEVKNSFKSHFLSFELILLRHNKLLSGYIGNAVKNREFRLNGSHLRYLLFQGKSLIQITAISSQFQKGLEVILPAEYISPIQLESDIVFGSTINMESVEEEKAAGLTIEQAHNVLITNGTSKDRELLSMKIVSELIIENIPSIIFDFTGNFSKLLHFFKSTQYENRLLHFTLGKTFTVDPLHSGIPYDENNRIYLDYVADAYALAFQKSEKEMVIFNSDIKNNPEIDISQLNIELKNELESRRQPMNTNVLYELTEHKDVFFHSSEDNLQNKTDVLTFIQNDKTIILDLSKSNEIKEQLFLAFIIISKIIHFIHEQDEYIPKIIILPFLDTFFDGYFLERHYYKNKVLKFLDPLTETDFGLIFSTEQIHSVHMNFLNYFKNIIAFRTEDNRDINLLKNMLRLDDTHGQGVYSKRRNTTYQIRNLVSMKPDEVLMRRSDLYQSFPVRIDIDNLKHLEPMKHKKIMKFMKRQGYDLKRQEEQIEEKTQKSIPEKDFGLYYNYWKAKKGEKVEEGIIPRFLKTIKKADKVALIGRLVKEELLKFIKNEAMKTTQNNREIRTIRDNLFRILVKHHYLVEDHPKHAGGNEAMITCYSVGPQFEKALNDSYESKKGTMTNVSIENIVNESGIDFDFKNDEIQDGNFRDAIIKIMYEKYYDLFTIYKTLNEGNYMEALEFEKNLLRSFLIDLYQEIYRSDGVVTKKTLEEFIDKIKQQTDFPFDKNEIISYLEKCEGMNPDDIDLESGVREIYNYLSNFFNVIQEKALKV